MGGWWIEEKLDCAVQRHKDEEVADIMLTMGIVKVEQKKSPNSKNLIGNIKYYEWLMVRGET